MTEEDKKAARGEEISEDEVYGACVIPEGFDNQDVMEEVGHR